MFHGINMFQMHKTKHVGLGSVCCTQLHYSTCWFFEFLLGCLASAQLWFLED